MAVRRPWKEVQILSAWRMLGTQQISEVSCISLQNKISFKKWFQNLFTTGCISLHSCRRCVRLHTRDSLMSWTDTGSHSHCWRAPRTSGVATTCRFWRWTGFRADINVDARIWREDCDGRGDGPYPAWGLPELRELDCLWTRGRPKIGVVKLLPSNSPTISVRGTGSGHTRWNTTEKTKRNALLFL